ncbi:uncharacterized protein LOC111631759 isoform X1 [Centruroides sculpturatus]|uniref:uncharacterized protein LOC111631759 isoform X1 n=1 Tax=Centruroides sculpturatus TaxID=218467 RepID=UPI000C6DC52A|nr:uncharacterized protein LOC111631759 isoform X1 [Centruroides sculpturatus]
MDRYRMKVRDKIQFGSPLTSSEGPGVPTNGEALTSSFGTQSNLKRRRTDEYEEMGMYPTNKLGNIIYSEPRGYASMKTFLMIRHNPFVYHTEDWKPRGCTMYLPLTEDIMINSRNIEQISFETDQFFLADEKGNYMGAKPGNAIHLWRFDPSTRKLYISRSVLFLKEQDYREVQIQLEAL